MNRVDSSSPSSLRCSGWAANAAALGTGWLVLAIHPLLRYVGVAKSVGIASLALAMIAVACFAVSRLNRRQAQISGLWPMLLFVVFLMLFSMSQWHGLNVGSDREDALRVELLAVVHHRPLYEARTYLGSPTTPLPGALLLASPFFAIEHLAWQNVFWTALFLIFLLRFFQHRATAMLLFAVLVLASPTNFGDLISGGDYVTNFFYVTIAAALLVRSLRGALSVAVLASVLVGITLASRTVYFVTLVPLLALVLQRTSRGRAALLPGVVVLSTMAITLPFYTPHPMAHLLGQSQAVMADKLSGFPAVFHPQVLLPSLALCVAGGAFFLRMTLARYFLLIGFATTFLLLPPVVVECIVTRSFAWSLSYLAVPILSVCLWQLARSERLSSTPALPSPIRR